MANASVHNSKVFEKLREESKSSRAVWADSAYRSATKLTKLEIANFREPIQRKRTRNKKLDHNKTSRESDPLQNTKLSETYSRSASAKNEQQHFTQHRNNTSTMQNQPAKLDLQFGPQRNASNHIAPPRTEENHKRKVKKYKPRHNALNEN